MSIKILSVSIAAYNVAETLEDALAPFTKNDIKEYVDVMIINDGSSDDTAAIASRYEAEYPETFRLISKENGGWGSTLNTAIKYAKGKYFKQLDGDDYYSHENLASYISFLKSIDSDLVYTPFVAFDDATKGILKTFGTYCGDYSIFPIGHTIPLNECDNFIPAMHTVTVKTEILRKNHISITEHCFYTDVEFVLKALNSCKDVTFFEKPIYYYRLARDGQSMSQSGVRKHYRDHQKMLYTMLEYCQNQVVDEHIRNIFETRLIGACNMQYIFYFALKCSFSQKKELIDCDTYIKENYPAIYQKIDGAQISFLRKTHFWGYKLVAWQKMRKDRRLRRNIFEGC